MSASFPSLSDIVIPGPSGDRPFRPPLVMGILNVTPDSFSDGGAHNLLDDAVTHAQAMLAEGADVLDIGGESTRPGAPAVSADEEIARTTPVIRKLREAGITAPISIDTMKARVAAAALDAGADIVNDVTAGTGDAEMLGLCAQRGCVVVLMHMRGTPRDMQAQTGYADVVGEVRDYLSARIAAAVSAGVARNRIWIDPGFGFAKLPEHNCALVNALDTLAGLGCPVLLGASRKSTLGHLTGSPVTDREPESLAAGLIGALKGAAVLRVHQPGPMRRALIIARAMTGTTRGQG
ncbi:MAG: dihydropteroate synthase [Planctomycetes bacterium]|nr:dihydropteroate synthase [Planctomycetota bacterium]